MPVKRVVIAGAGIIGASIAYHLARRGADVTVLEAAEPASGASGNSFGWINATFSKRPREYFDLSLAAIAEWHRLERELVGAIEIQWGGSVTWSRTEELRDDVRNHREWGYDVRLIESAELTSLLPNVVPGEHRTACWSVAEGTVDGASAVSALLDRARQAGADVRCSCAVTSFDLSEKRMETDRGPIEADALVLACGVDSARIAATAGVLVPLQDSPGVLVHTAPVPRVVDRVVVAPDVHFKQGRDGRIVIGGQLVAGVGTAAAPAQDAEQILERATRYLPAMQGIEIERVTVGNRVMPRDEYPIVGFAEQCPGLYVAAMHSGVTLAPLIGRLAAEEILEGIRASVLDSYRPGRFMWAGILDCSRL
jgi:glycine/D-amino acid oxidase-like deaminating enzyme